MTNDSFGDKFVTDGFIIYVNDMVRKLHPFLSGIILEKLLTSEYKL